MWCSLLDLFGSWAGSPEREAGLSRWWVMSRSAVTSWHCLSAHLASLPSRLCSFLLYHRSRDMRRAHRFCLRFFIQGHSHLSFQWWELQLWQRLLTWTRKEVWVSHSRLQNRVWNLPFIPRHDFFPISSISWDLPSPSSYNSCRLLSVQSILLKTKQNKKPKHYTKNKTETARLWRERMSNLCVCVFPGQARVDAHTPLLGPWAHTFASGLAGAGVIVSPWRQGTANWPSLRNSPSLVSLGTCIRPRE